MPERVQLTIDGDPAGDCDAEIFELVKAYLSDGRKDVDIARELRTSGVAHAITIVTNAKRELKLPRTS